MKFKDETIEKLVQFDMLQTKAVVPVDTILQSITEQIQFMEDIFIGADTSVNAQTIAVDGPSCDRDASTDIKDDKAWYETVADVIIGAIEGIVNAIVDIFKGLFDLLVALFTDPIGFFKGIATAIFNPADTFNAMWGAVEAAWERDVINGDARSRASFFSYAVVSVVGLKGADKLGKLGKTVSNVPYNAMNTSNLKDLVKNSVFGYMQQKGKQLEDLWNSNFSKEAINKTLQAVENSAIVSEARNVLNPDNIKAAITETNDLFINAYKSIDTIEIQKITKDMSTSEKMLQLGKNLGLLLAQNKKGKLDANIDVAKNTYGDIKELITNHKQVIANLDYALNHPKETITSIANSILDSFEKDMLNGNAYSRSYWLTNAKGTIATALLGTKGAGSLTKVGKVPGKPKTTVNENVTNKSWANKKFNELLDTPIWHNAYVLNGPTVPITVRDAFEQARDNLSQIKALGNGKGTKVEGFNPETATNKQKGNFGEIISSDNLLTNQSLKDAGYDLKPIGRGAPSSIDDKIVKGIDGLYENTNVNSNIKYVIDEAKFGSSQLGKTAKDGPQMSDNWLKGTKSRNSRILKAVDGDKQLAIKITNALDEGEVERVLSKVDSNGNIKTFRLNAKGDIIGEWP